MASRYYYVETLCVAYAKSVYPVGDPVQWNVPNEVKMMSVLLPEMRRRSASRPRKNKIMSQGEEKIRYKCSWCHQVGHNLAKCKEPFERLDKGETSGGTGVWYTYLESLILRSIINALFHICLQSMYLIAFVSKECCNS